MAKPTELGYSLHLKATEAINEFLSIIYEEDFQYLQEILLEAKNCFGSRQMQHELLPKTPCMKRSKRKRQPVNSESDENADPSSPQAEVKSRNTRNNKKQKISELSSTASLVLESVDENVELETSVQAAGRKTRSRACKATRSTRQQPTRVTRSSRRKIVNEMEKKNENPSENLLEKVPEENELVELCKPKRTARTVPIKKPETPQKVLEPELCEPEHKVSENGEENVSEQKPESSKKRKCSHTPSEGTLKTFQCVPDTPEAASTPETFLSSASSCKSVLNIVLSPLVIKDSLEKEKNGLLQPEQGTPSELEEKGSKETEVVTSCRKTLTRVSGVGSSTECSSKKKGSFSAGSKGKRSNKRKSSVERDIVSDNSPLQHKESIGGVERDSLTVSTTTPGLGDIPAIAVKHQEVEKTTEENMCNEQTDGPTSSQESQPVSSTMKSPEKKKRRSSRWVRKSLKSSTRRRSHTLASYDLPASVKKTQKSKALVKSSVKLKLTQSRLMPALKMPTVDSIALDDTGRMSGCSTHFDDVQQDLFGASGTLKANKKSSGSSDDLELKNNIEKGCQSFESSESTRSKSDDDDDDDDDDKVKAPSSQSSSCPSASEEGSPTSTSNDKYNTPKSRRSSSEDADEVFEDAMETVSKPEPAVTTHPALRKSGESKATVVLTKVQVKASSIATIHSFIRRNTPKKVKPEDKKKRLQMQIKQKEEREKEIKEKLEQQKQKELEERRRKREEKEKRAAALRAAKAKIEQEKKRQMEEKMKQLKEVDEKVKKKKEQEEEAKRKVRDKRKADLEARRKQEEDARQQKILDLAEEQKKQQELQRRKQEFEEEERKKKIAEAKKLQELRELELERERQMEKQRILKEIEEKERRQREAQERQEKEQRIREEKERERKNREEKERKLREEREEHERKRLAQLFKEKEEQERKERERKWQAEKEKLEKDRKLREEATREKKRQEEERERVLEEKRKVDETKRKALLSADSYQMTPPPVKVRKAASAENYDINDLNSDDSTDDEDAPRKRIPAWAQGPALKATLLNQEYMNIDTDLIFGAVAATPNLHEIFKVKRKRFYQRTSSAIWHSPPLRPGTYV